MHPPHHWRNVLIIVPIVGTAIATVFYLLRVYSRQLVVHGIGIEDALMGLGLLFTYGVAICIVYGAYNGLGIGLKIWVLPREQRLRIALSNWILEKFWPSAQVCVKVSIILFLRHLLGSVARFRQCATVVIVLVVFWGLAAVMGNTFQCWPVQYFWIKHIPGHCMAGQDAFFTTIGVLSMVQDVLILCLPFPIVWRLQMPMRQKAEITLLFSVGCLVCIFSVLRVIELRHYQTSNLSSSNSLTLLWTILELDMAIICGSLLLMKPVLRSCTGRMRKSITRLSSRSQSQGSAAAVRGTPSLQESSVGQVGLPGVPFSTSPLTSPGEAEV